MKITYLGHSGFLAETDRAYYLFDYIRGTLPVFGDSKPLYVFASHAHHDHWIPEIFSDEALRRADQFILGFDIEEPCRELSAGSPAAASCADRIIWAHPQQTFHTGTFSCTPLLSTDEGVAFPVIGENESIYHAGDLNLWHWNSDPDWRNLERTKAFQKEIDRLQGLHFDAAFVPLDPRLEDAYHLCMDYFLETVDADHVFPMHFWGNHDLTFQYSEALKKLHPDQASRFHPIAYEGEVFHI